MFSVICDHHNYRLRVFDSNGKNIDIFEDSYPKVMDKCTGLIDAFNEKYTDENVSYTIEHREHKNAELFFYKQSQYEDFLGAH